MEEAINNPIIMNALGWILFGFVVGLVVDIVDPGKVRGGMIATAMVGIIGAIIAGYVSSLFSDGGINALNIQSYFVSALGALVVAVFYSILFRKNQQIKTSNEQVR